MVLKKTWVLVMNGVRVRILGGFGVDGTETAFELYSKARSTHLRKMLADRSGQGFASLGPGVRSEIAPASDPILRDMQDFARDTLGLLERHHRAGDFEALAVFASPRMLGTICELMPSSLYEKIVFKQPVNLVQLSDDALRRVVLEALRMEAAT